ncbi:MAG: carbohydrate kinase family protein [Anaerolineales bacterium]|nr:carbohydrate kinase family protein [Anaerolineales bacterium]
MEKNGVQSPDQPKPTKTPRTLIAGLLHQQYILLADGRARINVPGGNLLFAAAGYAVWESDLSLGLLARVGKDYPQEWLNYFERRGFDTRGIAVQPEAMDLRYFIAYPDVRTRVTSDPVPQFARLGLPFPKALFGYQDPIPELDSRTKSLPVTQRQDEIPTDYLDAGAIHLAPIDYITHSFLPVILRQENFTTITIDPSPGYMHASYFELFPALINGVTAFLPSEDEVRNLFYGRTEDLWEMAEALASFGCEIIVIKCGLGGQILYDAASHNRWELPAYPNRVVDPTGAGSAFCGGFLAGYRLTYNPVEALLHGNISASLAVEGADPFYVLEALSGLPQARLKAMRDQLHKV